MPAKRHWTKELVLEVTDLLYATIKNASLKAIPKKEQTLRDDQFAGKAFQLMMR